MSMKNYFFWLILLLFSPLAKAQDFKWSNPVQTERGLDIKPVIFGEDSAFLYVFYANYHDSYIDKIRKDNLELDKSTHIGIPSAEYQKIMGPVLLNGIVHFFVKKQDGDSVSLFCYRVGDNIPFTPQKLMSVGWVMSNINQYDFTIMFSPDNQKIAVQGIITYPKGLKVEYEFKFSLFNSGLKLIDTWVSKYDLDTGTTFGSWLSYNNFVINHSMSVDNYGNVYYLRTNQDGRTWLFSFSGNDHKEKVRFLNLTKAEDGALGVPTGLYARDSIILIAGNAVECKAGKEYYSIFNNRKIEGTFAMIYEIKSGEVVSQTYNKFESPMDIYDDIFLPIGFYVNRNGNYTLINEVQYNSTNSADYANVCLMHHSGNGEMKWYKELPVVFRPDMSNLFGFRYVATEKDDNVHFFMNDPAFNESFIMSKGPDIAAYSVPLHFVIDSESIKFPRDYRRSSMLLDMKTRIDYYISDDKIYFIGSKGKYYRIGASKY